MPRDNAERVVEGARTLSPYLRERMLAAELPGKPVVLRELLPQDLKLEMDRLTRKEIVASARFLASVVGKAHTRQMDTPARESWMAELQRNRSKNLDAPSWLWTSVVELVASHERAYLEHCREYALAIGQVIPSPVHAGSLWALSRCSANATVIDGCMSAGNG
jgi:uncharacterized protein (DUF2252 family)